MTKKIRKVQVWIWRRSLAQIQVLLLKTRAERGSFWQPVTGSVEPLESDSQAAVREASEESGMHWHEVTAEPLERPFSYTRGDVEFEENSFALEAPLDGEIRLDPNEHVEYQWVSPAEALKWLKYPSNAEILRALARKKNWDC